MFEIEIASCDVPCAAIVAGANVLAIVTFGRFTTVSVAVAGPGLVEPCVVESAPVGIVLNDQEGRAADHASGHRSLAYRDFN